MEQNKLLQKQQRAVELSMEIARLSRILAIKQRQFDKLDAVIYNEMKSKGKENESQQPVEDNK